MGALHLPTAHTTHNTLRSLWSRGSCREIRGFCTLSTALSTCKKPISQPPSAAAERPLHAPGAATTDLGTPQGAVTPSYGTCLTPGSAGCHSPAHLVCLQGGLNRPTVKIQLFHQETTTFGACTAPVRPPRASAHPRDLVPDSLH